MSRPHQFPGSILMNAQARLLPAGLPYRFFATAIVFHIFLWPSLFVAAPNVPEFSGGLGNVLATLHILTLGVIVMTAMGASFQLLPVATGVGHLNLSPAWLTWWLYVPGVLILVTGFVMGEPWFLRVGGILSVSGILLFLGVVASLLWRARTLPLPVSFAWVAILSMLVGLGLGAAMIADFDFGFLADREQVAVIHMILAGYGFMGFLAFGFSYILVPMFALSSNPPTGLSWGSFYGATTSLVIVLAGVVFSDVWLIGGGAIVGLATVFLYLETMLWTLNNGMRKNLGLSFVVIKASWVMLPLGILVGAAWTFGLLGDEGGAIFGFLLLFGWLLTFLMGVLQRIIPFLAGMNMTRKVIKPPRLSQMADAWTLKVHAVCHGGALALICVGITANKTLLIHGGAVCGLIGALCFAWFTISVLRGFYRYHRDADVLERQQQEMEKENTGNGT